MTLFVSFDVAIPEADAEKVLLRLFLLFGIPSFRQLKQDGMLVVDSVDPKRSEREDMIKRAYVLAVDKLRRTLMVPLHFSLSPPHRPSLF